MHFVAKPRYGREAGPPPTPQPRAPRAARTPSLHSRPVRLRPAYTIEASQWHWGSGYNPCPGSTGVLKLFTAGPTLPSGAKLDNKCDSAGTGSMPPVHPGLGFWHLL